MRKLNGYVVGASILLCVLGLISLSSLTPPTDAKGHTTFQAQFWKQVIFLCVGVVAMFVLAFTPITRLSKMSYVLYALAIAALVGLFVIAKPVRGVRAWYLLGSITIQPAEFAKVALILAVARFMASVENWKAGHYLELLILAAVPVGLTAVQPDFGLSFLMSATFFLMLLASPVRWKFIAGLVLVVMALAPLVFMFGLREYQRDRILALVSPSKVSPEKRDQQQQAVKLTAIGGIAGRGIGEATLSYPYYLAERHNDFIFSVIGEEMGFAGTLLVLVLFGLILYQALLIAFKTRDLYTRMAVVGCASALFVQTAINLGMTLGLLPVTGLTLPFVSYGGSSLVSSFLLAGVILSANAHWVPAFSEKAIPNSQVALELPHLR